MLEEYLLICVPIIALLSNIIVQLATYRTIRNMELMKTIFLGFFVGVVFLLLYQNMFLGSITNTRVEKYFLNISNLLIYICLGYCYFAFINLNISAMRIRILQEIYATKKKIGMDDILLRYNGEEQIELRLRRLIRTGQIIHRNGKYRIGKPTMLILANIVTLMKLLILGKRTSLIDN